MPPHPTRSAFLRASTLSLGSIAFGSLIVTILELVRFLLNLASQSAADDGNRESLSLAFGEKVHETADSVRSPAALAILACCAACLIGCIEGLVEYFNKYAYIEIALYGVDHLHNRDFQFC